ncbi:MAG: glycosyltransferase [Prevotellaceae bacterium]|nr:glycosyltransferase [Candidatus Faecinaster equi]
MSTYKRNIVVAIRCLVYNHEPYLRQCLDSIVMQQTDFPYFAVVHDDCSTDHSADIIREYAAKYPDKIHPIYEDFNCYKVGWKIADDKIHAAYENATYIAICEGDDYWIDPYKLQKQVDFLESHLDYSVCAHETMILAPNGTTKLFSDVANNIFVSIKKTDYTPQETLTGNIFHWSSFMYRNVSDFQMPQWRYRISAGDMVYFRYYGMQGKTHRFPEVMSVYRFHAKSVTKTEDVYQTELNFVSLNIKVLRLLNRYWNRQYQHLIYPIISRYYMRSLFVCWSKSGRDYALARKMAKKAWLYNKTTFVKYLWIESYRKLKKHL